MRRLLVILTFLVPLLAAAMEFPDSVKPLRGYDWKPALYVQQAADSLTGLWAYPERGMIVGIEKHTENASAFHSPAYYRIVAIESADKTIDRGTIVGYMVRAAAPSELYCYIYRDLEEGLSHTLVESKAVITAKGKAVLFSNPELSFRLRVNLARVIPNATLQGLGIYPHFDKEKPQPGLRKIETDNTENETIYF